MPGLCRGDRFILVTAESACGEWVARATRRPEDGRLRSK
jgi:hypothetical protein